MAFPTTGPVLDDFNRSDRSLNGDEMSSAVDSWGAVARIDSGDSDGQITSNKFALAASGTISARGQRSYDRLASGVGRGVEAWATITDANTTAGASCQLWWAISDPNTATPDGYLLRYEHNGNSLEVVRVDNGVETRLGAFIAGHDLFSHQFGIWHEDDGSGTIHVYKNEGSGWEEITTRTDTTYDTGFLGLAVTQTAAQVQFAFDDFGGGEAAPALVTVTDPIVLTEVVHFDKSVTTAPTTQIVGPTTIGPNGMWLMGTRQTAYGDAAEANHFLGFAASPAEQWGIWAGREDAVVASASHAQKANAAHILLLYDLAAHTAEDDPINEPIALSRADLDAFFSDGFRLSYPDDNNAEAAKCHAFLFRGIREVAVVQEDFNLDTGAVGDERDWAAGFPPDVVQFLAMGMFDSARFGFERFGVAEPTIGAAINAADRWSSSVVMDWHTFEEEDNVQVENRCVAVPTDNETGGYQGRFELDYVEALTTGFRTRVVRQDPASLPPVPPENYNWRVAALALGGLNVELVKFNVQTSLGFQKIPTSFTPVGALFVSASRNKDYNVHNVQTQEALQSIGFTDGVEQAAIWSQSKILALSIDSTETNIKNRADRCIILAQEPTVKQQEARIVGWDTDGIWIEWMVVGGDVVSTDDWEVLILVLGDATDAPGGSIATGTQIVRQPDQVVAY